MIDDRWLVVFARRVYGDAYADMVARKLLGNRRMANHLRRSLTVQMRRASS